MKLRFGIREKTAALAMAVAALTALMVGFHLFNVTEEIVVDHELVDLSDEAQLRAWEIHNRIEDFKKDLMALSLSEELAGVVRGAFENPAGQRDTKAIEAVIAEKSKAWYGFSHFSVINREGEKIDLNTLTKAGGDDRETVGTLLEAVRRTDDLQMAVSEIERFRTEVRRVPLNRRQGTAEAAQRVNDVSEYGEPETRSIPVIWGSTEVAAGEFLVLIGLNLETSVSATDPRHFGFLINRANQEYLIHPDMETAKNFRDEDVFGKGESKWQIEKEKAPQPKGESDGETGPARPPTFFDEIAYQQERESESSTNSWMESGRIPPVSKVAFVETAKLKDPYRYHFRAGQVTDEARNMIENLDADKSIAFNEKMQDLLAEFGRNGRRVGGISNQVNEMRILAPTREEAEKLEEKIESEVGRVLKEITGSANEIHLVDWTTEIRCERADVSGVRIRVEPAIERLELPAPFKQFEQPREYWFLYAAFREELAGSAKSELASVVPRAVLLTVLAGVIAFFAALLFVRPLERMTEGARYLARSPGDKLHANIRRMTGQIPDKRKDEVGDIAKAAKKLFEAVTESYRQHQESKKKLEEHKEILEEEVERRTIQLRKQNEELEDAAKEKDKFLASVSHELRTPLTVVAGNLQLLQRKKLGEKELGYVKKALAGSKRLEALIRDLLDIQKIIMGGMSLDPEDFEIPELLQEIEDTLQPNAKKNGNRLAVRWQNLGMVHGDKVRINQVLSNLVTNACKFTHDGEIRVEGDAWESGGEAWMKFTVTDTGRGMNEEEQRQIFNRFYTNKKANESGTGLGLDICTRLCDLMGGRVYLKESGVGVGSVFAVELPQAMKATRESTQPSAETGRIRERAETETPESYPVDPESPPTVLVIDDEPGIQDLMNQHLAERGYRVIVAESGEKGLELARSEKPDLITLDVMMDGNDGWEVIQLLKGDSETNAIPVVMVTILDREDKGFALGAADYFTKPVDWDRMLTVLGRLTSPKSGNRALLVEDDEAARQLFRSVLSREGWKVTEAEHGRQALDAIAEEVPNVIVLDLMMPEMDGIEFLEEFHKHPEWKDIPIIVVTAKEMNRAERKMLDESVARVIQKGTQTASELLDEIQHWATRVRASN